MFKLSDIPYVTRLPGLTQLNHQVADSPNNLIQILPGLTLVNHQVADLPNKVQVE